MTEAAILGKTGLARSRWRALLKINLVSVLAQIIQTGTIAPLLSLTLDRRGVDPTTIGLIVGSPWIAIILTYKLVPRILHRVGLVFTNAMSIFISMTAIIAMAYVDDLYLLFALNFTVGVGLILRWIACDTWIVVVASQVGRGRAIGMHEALMGFGIALGPLLLSITGIEGKTPFFVGAALIGAALIPLYALWPENHRPGIPKDKSDFGIFLYIPTALLGAFVAGFVETSSISFLPLYSIGIGYAAVAATLMVFYYGAGATILQLPLGWLADRISYRRAQYMAVAVVFCGALLIPFIITLPWLAWLIIFIWGGAVGGMNTLAVIEAGERMPAHKLTLAMTTIAMCYTMGSIIGPIATGATIEHVSRHGLLLTSAIACVFFLVVVSVRVARSSKTASATRE